MRARHWRAQRHHHARRLSRPHVHHGQGGHQGPVRPGPTNVARQWAERGVLLQPDPPSAEGGPPWQQMERLTPLSPLALGRRHSSYNLPFLNHLEKYVARAARVAVPFNNYVTGSCAFTHKAGVHSKVGMVLLPCALVVHRCPLTPSPHLSPPPPARPSCRTLLRTKCSTRRTLACSAPLRYPCTGAKLRQPGQHLLPPPPLFAHRLPLLPCFRHQIAHRLTGWNALRARAKDLKLTLSDDVVRRAAVGWPPPFPLRRAHIHHSAFLSNANRSRPRRA